MTLLLSAIFSNTNGNLKEISVGGNLKANKIDNHKVAILVLKLLGAN